MAFVTPLEKITGLYIGYFNRAPDPEGASFWIGRLNAGATLVDISNSFAQIAGEQGIYQFFAAPNVGSPTAFLTAVYSNLLGRSSVDAGGLAFWTAQLQNPAIPKGRIIVDILSAALGVTGSPEAALILNKIEVGKTFVQTLVDTNAVFNLATAKAAFNGVTSDVATVTTANAANSTAISSSNVATASQVIRLTENVDLLTGGATNDTFDGTFVTTVAGFATSFNSNDSLDGGLGVDTLIANALGTFTAPTVFKNIEVVDFQSSSIAGLGTSVVDLNAGDSALTTVKFTNSGTVGNNLTVTNIQSAPTNFVMSNIGAGLNFNATVAISKLLGATDAATIQLNNVAAVAGVPTSIVILGNTGTSGYETITIDSIGSVANALAGFGDGISTSLATINVTGTASLTLTLTDTSVVTVDASALVGTPLSGKLNLTVAATNAKDMTITGGSGNDVVNLGGTYTNLDILNGGAGTGDRLTIANAQAIAVVSAQANVTNFEVLGLSNALSGTVTPGFFGATGVRLFSTFPLDFPVVPGLGAASIINYAAGAANTLDLVNSTSGGFSLTANIAGSATNDVLGITIGSAIPNPAPGNTFGPGGVIINGAETVNLNSIGGPNSFGGVFTLTPTAASESIIITGSQAITFGGVVTADNIDASALTGGALVLTFGTAAATIITGTAFGDTLIASGGADIITAGAGNDLVTGLAGADIINVGSGTDNIFYTAAGQTFSGAVASGVTNLSATVDVVTGMSAGDVINVFAGATITAATATSTTLLTAGAVDTVALVRGDFAGGIFTATAGGADTLFQYDDNGAAAAGSIESIVLVGFTGATGVAGINLFTLS